MEYNEIPDYEVYRTWKNAYGEWEVKLIDGVGETALHLSEDPDAPDTVFTHWLVYDIPMERQELPEGVNGHPELHNGGKQGQNDFGDTGFGGPCPPQGMHRYVFRLFALDQTLEMAPGSNKGDLLKLMQGHILETAEITSTYARQS